MKVFKEESSMAVPIQELYEEADSTGRFPGGVITHYFRNGKEIGHQIDGIMIGIRYSREWCQDFYDTLEITKINLGKYH